MYFDLADLLFPDAGIIGISGYVKLLNRRYPVVGMAFAAIRNAFRNQNLPAIKPSGIFALTAGGIFGVEAVFSFGSSQLGLFWYAGLQAEAQISSNRWWDVNLSTGYVWNLWNCEDYTGAFRAVNTPWVSRFWDPEDISNNTGPWGYSWPIHGTSTTLFGGNATWFRYLVFPPEIYSYGALASLWAVEQADMLAISALNKNVVSSSFTIFGAVFTGMIAKSKEIYNRSWARTKPKPIMTLHTLRQSNGERPKGIINWYTSKGVLIKKDYWRSGPKVPWAIYATGL